MKFIYFFKETGCDVCKSVEPVLDEWRKTHPNTPDGIFIIKLDLKFLEWEKFNYTPRMVPSYLFTYEEGFNKRIPIAKHEGALATVNQLEKFIRHAEHELRQVRGETR